MPLNTPSSPATPGDVAAHLRDEGYAFVTAAQGCALLALPAGWPHGLAASWSHLPRDGYLRDGGRYRARRHSCFIQEVAAGTLAQTPHRAHWQGVAYNALHGGMERWYEPVTPEIVASPVWAALLLSLGRVFAQVLGHIPLRYYVQSQPRFFVQTYKNMI